MPKPLAKKEKDAIVIVIMVNIKKQACRFMFELAELQVGHLKPVERGIVSICYAVNSQSQNKTQFIPGV